MIHPDRGPIILMRQDDRGPGGPGGALEGPVGPCGALGGPWGALGGPGPPVILRRQDDGATLPSHHPALKFGYASGAQGELR